MSPSFRHFIVTTIIGGAVVLLPIVILIFLIKLVVQFVDGILQPLSELIGPNSELPPFALDVIALGIVIAFCFTVGLVVRTSIGKGLIQYIEKEWLDKLPAYRTIRDIVQQFTGARDTPFKTVVAVDVYNTGTRMTGFITDQPEEGLYTVFVPTAPNPTNGYIFHVAKEQLEVLDVKPEEAMRVVIGMGVGSNKILDKSVINAIKDDSQESSHLQSTVENPESTK